MSKPASMHAALRLHDVVSDRLGTRSADSKLPSQNRLHRIGLIRVVVISLMVQLLGVGCVRWVPIEPDFANGTTRRLDRVRIDGDTILEGASISGPILSASRRQYAELTTIDLRKEPTRVDVPPNEAAAIAKGQTRELDEVRVGDHILNKATITWPIITGYQQRLLTIDIRRQVVQREAIGAGSIVAIILVPLGFVIGGIALDFALHPCKPPPGNPCACRDCG